MTIWLTSDTHFNHAKILEYCPGRQKYWQTVEDMNQGLIERWNARVGPEDVVYHLGDFGLGKVEGLYPIMARLNGRKRLVRGNHDKSIATMVALGFHSAHPSDWFNFNEFQVHLGHHPPAPEAFQNPRVGNAVYLHGHVHEQGQRGTTEHGTLPNGKPFIRFVPDPAGRCLNVGVDVRDFFPVSLKELLQAL